MKNIQSKKITPIFRLEKALAFFLLSLTKTSDKLHTRVWSIKPKVLVIILVFFILNLLAIGFVIGAEKDLSVSIQVVGENTSSENTETAGNQGELGSLNPSIENELPVSSNQNIVQRIFSSSNGKLLSLKIEKNSIVFIFSFLAIFLFMIYIILLISKIKRVIKKKNHFRNNSKYL